MHGAVQGGSKIQFIEEKYTVAPHNCCLHDCFLYAIIGPLLHYYRPTWFTIYENSTVLGLILYPPHFAEGGIERSVRAHGLLRIRPTIHLIN